MNAETVKEMFGQFVLWFCGLGMAAIFLGWGVYTVSKAPAHIKASAKKYGWGTVVVMLGFMVWATINGTPTNDDKDDYNQQQQQEQQLNNAWADALGLRPSDERSGIVVEQLSGTDLDGVESDSPSSHPMLAMDFAGEMSETVETMPSVRPLTAADYEAGIALARIGTNEVWNFDAPEGADVCADWARFGAARDWFRESFTNGWRFAFGTNHVDALTVFSSGLARPSVTNAESFFAPLRSDLGIVPASNWEQLSEPDRPSRYWQGFTPSNTFVMTWQNVLLGGDANRPVSFQAEFFASGDVMFRYDLDRQPDGVLTNLVVGICNKGVGRVFTRLAKNTTSLRFAHLDPTRPFADDPDHDGLSTEDELFVYHTDPYKADTDMDGLPDGVEVNDHGTDPLDPHSAHPSYPDGVAVVIGDLDPFSCPEGSTNTVWEHVFYTGTTNAPFAYPASSDSQAVLRVTVSGSGSGELIVGDRVVPLLGTPSSGPARARARSGEAPGAGNSLQVPIVKGESIPVYLRGDCSLSVGLDSYDFAFGLLPDFDEGPLHGYINFPNTKATTPCIHDFNARRKTVTLPVRLGADELTCTWQESMDVQVENRPPRSAEITGNFSARSTGGITYTLAHPNYLFGQTQYDQTVRFCPRPPPKDDDDDDGEDPAPGWYDHGDGDSSEDGDENHEEHWCCHWGTCCDSGDCRCGCDCCTGGSGEGSGGGSGGEDEEPDDDDVCEEHNVPYEDCMSRHYTNAVENVMPLGGVLYIRNPPRYESISLTAPTEHRNCCPCPDHRTNYVGVAYKSCRLKLIDDNGLNFSKSETDCTVHLAGVHPSSQVGDAELAFARNGEIYQRYRKTVLGVGIDGNNVDLSVYNSLAPDFGFPFTVTTNLWRAPVLNLRTSVKLPTGHVHVELKDVEGQFTVWYCDYDTGECRVLLDSTGRSSRDMTLARWKRLMRSAAGWDSPTLPVSVTSASAGHASIVLRYWGIIDGRLAEDTAELVVTSLNPPLLPDYTRDGRIDASDAVCWDEGERFRYWINEDCDKGDYVGQYSDTGPKVESDPSLANVKGRLDLVNLFPVALDLKPFGQAWGAGVAYRIRMHANGDGPLRFCFADVPWISSLAIQTNDVQTVSGTPLHSTSLMHLNQGMYTIPRDVLSGFSARSGMLVAEATERIEYRPLSLEIVLGDTVLFRHELPLRIRPVKEMYSWINGRRLSGEQEARGTQCRTRTHDKALVFLHGANVSEAAAEKWGDAIFKRMWLSGMNADFYNVDWRSDIGSVANYHRNASNAFEVASALAPTIKGISGEKVIIAHSLGNMVVSSMIQDHGLQVSKYLMCDSAVPSEAYYPAENISIRVQQLVHPDWETYPTNSWVSNWHKLFKNDAGDDRKHLGWPARFLDVTQYAVNFFSTGDEVLELRDSNGIHLWTGLTSGYTQYAWHHQELWKGRGSGNVLGATTWSGWNIEENMFGANKISVSEAIQMNARDSSEFKTNTVFYCYPSSMASTNINLLVRAAHLTQGIPALARPTGGTSLSDVVWAGDNYDLNNSLGEHGGMDGDDTEISQSSYGINRPNGWPTRSKWGERWLHSDMKDVSYFYNYMFYKKVVEKGGLQ